MYFDVLFGCGVFRAELRPAEVDPRFKKILRHNCGVAKIKDGHNFQYRASKINQRTPITYKSTLIDYWSSFFLKLWPFFILVTPHIFDDTSRFAGISRLRAWLARTKKSVRALRHMDSELWVPSPKKVPYIFLGYAAFYEENNFLAYSAKKFAGLVRSYAQFWCHWPSI